MLTYFLYGLFILACVILIISVLLQPGKADAGALFTSSVSSTAFGPRGTQTLLAKISIGAAAAFMLIALTLSVGIGTRRSVLESEPEPAATPQPAASPATAASPQSNAETPAGEQKEGVAATPANTTATPTGSPATQQASPKQ